MALVLYPRAEIEWPTTDGQGETMAEMAKRACSRPEY